MRPAKPAPANSTFWPTVGLLAAAFISGLYWLPLRQVEKAGIGGLWAPLAIAVVAALPLLWPLGLRWRRPFADWRDLALIGLLMGGAYGFYAVGFMLTDVVRVVLLFYLAPVWGTLLEILVLRRPFTMQRAASLVLGIGGLAVILGAGEHFALTVNIGDALALAAGLMWSVGILVVFKRVDLATGDQFAAQAAGAAIAVIALVAGGLGESAPPPAAAIIGALPWLLFVALLLTVPMWCLSLWASRHLPPARTTLLFMIEVCIGVGSAALLSGDPFGWREAAGSALIVSAALVELKRQPNGIADQERLPEEA